MTIVLVIAGAILASVFGWFIAGRIRRAAVLVQVARGHGRWRLTVPAAVKSRDELGAMADALSTAQRSVSSTLAEVVENVSSGRCGRRVVGRVRTGIRRVEERQPRPVS